ncbi:hypothetical protein [Paenibacillus alkalitolerans]|uniref:hypothetical protein n=1 Tax=Paenibacillus alkalitolerans TaxID=2799335 RepID=UPI0018F327A5|nr:hypothetical protein [Paenibacillus alkalitolerans]
MQANIALNSPTDKARVGTTIDFFTILFALWLLSGVFIDGYAHGHIDETLETFFTPWHAILYSGFVACALWFAWLTYRNYRLGWRGSEAIPLGYGSGIAGVLIFAFGGVSDMIWHIIFGIETGIEALYSPSHLCLFVGGTLIVYSPFKRAWIKRSAEGAASPSFVQLLPALVSLAFATSFTAFFAMNFWAFIYGHPTQGYNEWVMGLGGGERVQHYLYDQGRVQGIADILITNAILIIPMLVLLKRWNPPFGSFTLLMTVPMIFMSVLDGFDDYSMIAVGIVSGLTADLVWRVLRMTRNGWKLHLFMGLLSALVWGLYFLVIEIISNVSWEPEFWGGAIFLAALSSLVFGKLSTAEVSE